MNLKTISKSIYFILTLNLFSLLFPTTPNKTFIACEGHFYGGLGAINVITADNNQYTIDNLGNVVQSLLMYQDKLFVAVNGSSLIHIYQITELEDILLQTIETGFSGPREMEIHGDYLYFTNWYSNDIKYLSLNDLQILGNIPVNGLPEDILSDGVNLWVTINMKLDWTDGNTVLKINTETNDIEEYNVGLGPKNLILHNEDIYISRVYYDGDWNTFHGTSRINSNGEIEEVNYGVGLACGGSIMKYNNQIYRSYDGGIAPLDENLNIQESMRIGDYGYSNVYDIKAINDNVYIAITNWNDLNAVAILDYTGEEIGYYNTGIIPTDFETWNICIANGDYNQDNITNISDIIAVVDIIINNENIEICSIDMDHNELINISDIILMIDYILE